MYSTEQYADLPADYAFAPMAFETLGGLGASCAGVLSKLAALLSQKTKNPSRGARLFRTLSAVVQRGNAAAVREALESTEQLHTHSPGQLATHHVAQSPVH